MKREERVLSSIEVSILDSIGNDEVGKTHEDVRAVVDSTVGKQVSTVVVNTFLSRLLKKKYIKSTEDGIRYVRV